VVSIKHALVALLSLALFNCKTLEMKLVDHLYKGKELLKYIMANSKQQSDRVIEGKGVTEAVLCMYNVKFTLSNDCGFGVIGTSIASKMF